tara:strand:- start:836 stop:1432 length:597 start_codon:yes stop_codon:yes gene_type:complete
MRPSNLLPTEKLDQLLYEIVSSEAWQKAQEDFNQSEIIFIIGNGGNLAVADHGAVDITRLSDKLAIAPGSGILATSVIGDSSINTWFLNWLKAHLKVMSKDKSKHMVIGVSSSGTASNICGCLEHASQNNMKTLMISARNLENLSKDYNTVQLGTDYYHTGEVLSLMLFYQLITGSGASCPSISKKLNEPSFDRLVSG